MRWSTLTLGTDMTILKSCLPGKFALFSEAAIRLSSYADRVSLSYAQFPPGSEDLAKSVARTNFLHHPYRQNGKISNGDMLYVLFESMHEPIRFMRLYEWREMVDMEVAAIAMFWKYLGEMMEIDYKAELGKDQWKDGIEFMEDVAEWAAEYENKHLGPSPDIAKLGKVLVELLLSAYPKFMRESGYKILMVLMGERMRHAFK